ncbi:MAG: hypothetical protein PHG05_00390 [Candidatus Nanoarchaeia archaeon]|nr:hypothetical protein [Candidatus Nanoarchaeia archaeon]
MFNKIKNKKVFSKGKRSVIYVGYFNNQKVAIKKVNKRKEIEHSIKNEAIFLKILNKHKIGPKLIYSKNNYVVYGFVEGEFIENFFENSTKRSILVVIKKIIYQCYVLDKLKINKLEMHHPYKHILINKNKVTMIDFERAYFTEKPKNVTQFLSYLISKKISLILKKKGININKNNIIKISKQYKKDYSKKSLNKIKNVFK